MYLKFEGSILVSSYSVISGSGFERTSLIHFTWLYVCFPATRHAGVEDDIVLRPLFIVDTEQIILSSKRDRPDGLLHEIVVYVEASVLHVPDNAYPYGEGITQRLLHSLASGVLLVYIQHISLQILKDGVSFSFSLRLNFLGWGFLVPEVFLQLIKHGYRFDKYGRHFYRQPPDVRNCISHVPFLSFTGQQ